MTYADHHTPLDLIVMAEQGIDPATVPAWSTYHGRRRNCAQLGCWRTHENSFPAVCDTHQPANQRSVERAVQEAAA